MTRGYLSALILAAGLAAGMRTAAQAPAASQTPGDAQKPATTPPQSNANPFPEDTSSVPVLPSKGTPALPEGTYTGTDSEMSSHMAVSGEATDPVRSPDDPAPEDTGAQGADSSSSLKNIESLLPPPDNSPPDKKRKPQAKEPTHKEAAAEDIDVGGYYLDRKNWRAALSRFESAMVLDPENPDVYWGLAEAERNLGQFAKARADYQKLLDYDPENRHAKQARKTLKDPALASATPHLGSVTALGAAIERGDGKFRQRGVLASRFQAVRARNHIECHLRMLDRFRQTLGGSLAIQKDLCT